MTTTLPASITNLVKPTVYVSCADTAKLIRKALKEAFPEVKFSVKSSVYAGGASIRINWSEGPTKGQVEAVGNRFKGADFDAMTDSKSYRGHAMDGQPISFGADFIFISRETPAEKIEALTSIFERVDKADWLTLACKFGMGEIVLRGAAYHFNAREIAEGILRELPAPQFDGRRSPTAETVNILS